jgi:putative transposase
VNAAKYAWIEAHRKEFSVAAMCRVLKVSGSGFYAWKDRKPSPKQQRREELVAKMRVIHAESDRTFGSPRMHLELLQQGVACNVKTVAKQMKSAGIQAKTTKKFRICTTDSNHSLPVAENILNRDFTADKPNEKWVGDITYIPTRAGWLYLAVVIDLFSRMVVGWSMSVRMTSDLVVDALQMAIARCKPSPGLLVHSDRGSQYASHHYQELLDEHGFVCSMSRKGNCWDNAVAESFFATLKKEKVHHEDYHTHEAARGSLFEYIEIFYNRWRPHSSIEHQRPYERQQAS